MGIFEIFRKEASTGESCSRGNRQLNRNLKVKVETRLGDVAVSGITECRSSCLPLSKATLKKAGAAVKKVVYFQVLATWKMRDVSQAHLPEKMGDSCHKAHPHI